MEKIIKVGGKDVKFKSTARTPILYRCLFHRDFMRDMLVLENKLKKAQAKNEEFDMLDLEIFENVSYTMARHANENIEPTKDEWFDTFEIFDIYEVLPEILKLWGIEISTQIESKKKLTKITGN